MCKIKLFVYSLLWVLLFILCKKSLRVELYLSLTDTLGSELASTAVTDVIHQKGNSSKGICLLPVDDYYDLSFTSLLWYR